MDTIKKRGMEIDTTSWNESKGEPFGYFEVNKIVH
jgi:hypothetical protein